MFIAPGVFAFGKVLRTVMFMASTRYGNVFMKWCFINISESPFKLCVNRMYIQPGRGGDCILPLQEMWRIMTISGLTVHVKVN